ncbi:MAG: dihydropteroate synthase [Methanomassiliicoccaceae archaeon]|nr:dihydropteroate synthase [Methanomassiliicoccaceae archaeon]
MITSWRRGSIDYGVKRIMGIINMTPDSFSDKVRYSGKSAVERIFRMADEGADIIDVGGESTRPGSTPVTPAEETSRITDVIRIAAPSLSIPISVDTMHPETALAALDAGAEMINDVSGLRNENMMRIVASAGVPVVIMHMHGMPRTMQENTMQGDAVEQISDFFDSVSQAAESAGIKRDKIILDPGIGFGKTFPQNVEIIQRLGTLRKGYPLLLGTSMKSFLAYAYPNIPTEEAGLLSAAECARNGADILRVHDVEGTVRMIRVQRS